MDFFDDVEIEDYGDYLEWLDGYLTSKEIGV